MKKGNHEKSNKSSLICEKLLKILAETKWTCEIKLQNVTNIWTKACKLEYQVTKFHRKIHKNSQTS